ncbi:MAG: carboxypeptidase-like regulatory domain-containing protein [Planctomycetota bacterium]
MPMNPCHAAVLALLAAAAGAQTTPFPPAGSDPTGMVLDEAGQPIAGAVVELLASADPNEPFACAIGAVLRRTPLPRLPAQRDGTFVLPLTGEQRQLGAAGEGRFWLRVQAEGYLAWLEPLPEGLAGYLGSRVILRPAAADDPFAAVPWPPSPIALGTFKAMAMWCPLPATAPAIDRRGPADASPAAPSSTDAPCREHRLRCTDETGRPIADADLLFDNSCFAADASLPAATDATGSARLRLPAGEHRVRVRAADFLARVCTFTTDDDDESTSTFVLARGEVVDVQAIDTNGRPVPFTTLGFVPYETQADLPADRKLTDSCGRVRTMVPGRELYFVYQDTGEMDHRVGLGPPGNVVQVRKERAVTVLLRRVADLPERGDVVWLGKGGFDLSGRGYAMAAAAECVVTRAVVRDADQTWFAATGAVPLRVRHAELPPSPDDPLLDLVALDRPLRLRATLRLRSSSGSRVRRISVRPTWQGARGAFEPIEFARVDDDGTWTLWARDDGAYELEVAASNHLPARLVLPDTKPGAPPLELEVDLRHK